MSTRMPTADVDLSAANAAALADLQAELTAAPAAEVTPPVTETPVTPPASEQATTPPPSEPVQSQELPQAATPVLDPDAPPDDVDELKKGYLRHRDYTKKTMSLAEERKQATLEREQARAALEAAARVEQEVLYWRQIANNPEYLQQLAEQTRAAQNQPAPDETISYQQLQSIRQADRAAIKAELAREFREELIKMETGRAEHQFFQELDAHGNALLEKNPILKTVRGVHRLIAEDARARGPKSAAEFKQFMAEEAEDRARELTKSHKDHEQAAIMRHAKQAAAPTIQPPGGGIPAVQAPTKRLRLGSSELFAQIEQDLLAEIQRR
jgi:hypothetical protein